MKFKNPLDYVKNIINKFKELINYPYKRKIYSYILILVFLLSVPSSLICFISAYDSVPNKNNITVIRGTIKELNCYPVGFKHNPFCNIRVDSNFFRNTFGDYLVTLKNGTQVYIRDLLNDIYHNKKCVLIKYYKNLILELEYCDNETLYSVDLFENFYHQRKIALYLGLLLLTFTILSFLLLNKEFKKENQNF